MWLMSFLFGVVFAAAGLTAYLLLQTKSPAPQSQTASAAPAFQPVPVSAAAQNDPVLKNIELTGVRLTEDSNKKTYVQFVAVNHSGADLGDVSATVDLKSVNAKDQDPPVGSFPLKVTLGPYEAKDLKAPLTTKLRVYELPDWQFLRAQITGK